MSDSPASRQTLDRVADRLADSYSACFSRKEVAQVLHDSYDRLAEHATITAFLPILAERLAKERLDARAQAEGKLVKRAPEVLFVCVQNAGRSQIAAALTRYYSGGQIHIRTGGSDPGTAIHPPVVQRDEGDRAFRRRGVPQAAHR